MSGKTKKIKTLLTNWLNKQDHDQCWYYPEIFEQLLEILELPKLTKQGNLTKEQFQNGCKRFTNELFPVEATDRVYYELGVFYQLTPPNLTLMKDKNNRVFWALEEWTSGFVLDVGKGVSIEKLGLRKLGSLHDYIRVWR